ncbi:MAG: hypothetical protein AAFX92_08945 [Pseudomonadota bacterium]
MLTGSPRLAIALFVCAVLLAGSLSSLPAAGMLNVYSRADPPVFVTNLSGNPVELQWQTVVPNTVLSPPRGATIAVGASATLADEGLFWFHDPASESPVENVVFVSIVDANGAILSQVVMDEEIAGTLATVEATALHITIDADGSLTLSVRDAE